MSAHPQATPCTFASDVLAFHKREEANDALALEEEAQINELQRTGEACYPFNLENLTEALNQIEEADLADVAGLLSIQDLFGDTATMAELLGGVLLAHVYNYWEESARYRVQGPTPEQAKVKADLYAAFEARLSEITHFTIPASEMAEYKAFKAQRAGKEMK